MKRILIVFCLAAVLSSPTASAQDAPSGGVLSLIPKLEGGVLYDTEGETASPGFGNTSFYTLFEGDISPRWSFSLCNHWAAVDPWGSDFSAFAATADLYHFNVPRKGANNAANFLDWAYVTYASGPFRFTAGKQGVYAGGFESDDYDFDVNPFLASTFWGSYTCYQWGVTAECLLTGSTTLGVQLTTSPLNDGICLGLGWTGEYGPYSMKWGILTYDERMQELSSWSAVLSLGNRLTLGPLTLTVDWMNRCGDPFFLGEGFRCSYPAVRGNTVVGSALYTHGSGKWDLGAKAAWNGVSRRSPYGQEDLSAPQTLSAGVWGSWYPLRDSQNLRVQAAAGLTEYTLEGRTGYLFATLGVTWNFEITLW